MRGAVLDKRISNTSTKDIAKAANVAEGTIYKHFGTKENLLYATIFPILRDIIQRKRSPKCSHSTIVRECTGLSGSWNSSCARTS